MDEDEEYVDNRDEVLRKFREQLSKPVNERFFDEDFLLDAFDYAGDIQNDYLRMEALLCLARYYPDSEYFNERRGIFYSQYSTDTAQDFLQDNPESDCLILESLRLREEMPQGEEAARRLDQLIADRKDLTDEEVIQFVGAASAIGQLQWIKDNMPMLREKSNNANVLPYEVAIAAEMNRDHAFAIELLEELTEAEPFNSFFWMALARQYFDSNEGEKALSAVDYSLAINPDAPLSLLMKARILYAFEKPLSEVLPLLEKATKILPDNLEIARYMASVYYAENQPELSRKVLTDAVANGASEIEVIPELLIYGAEDPDKLFDRYFTLAEENTQAMWATWAQQLSMQGYPSLAKKALACYERHTGEKIPSLFTVEDAFIAQDFKQAIDDLDEYIKCVQGTEVDFPAVVAVHLVSMAKVGELTKAVALCDFIEKNLDITQYKNVAFRLEFIGLLALIANFKRRVVENPHDWDDYDPLQYWQ